MITLLTSNISAIVIIAIILAIIVHVYVAKRFSSAAEDKGYERSEYFWTCFWLGFIGWLIVTALPDRTTQLLLDEIRNKH